MVLTPATHYIKLLDLAVSVGSHAAGQWTCRVTALSGVVIVACFFTLQVMLLPWLLPESRSTSVGMGIVTPRTEHLRHHSAKSRELDDDDLEQPLPLSGDAQEVVVLSTGDDQVGLPVRLDALALFRGLGPERSQTRRAFEARIHHDKRSFQCGGPEGDGTITIPLSWVQDDFCDCPDGSDEPGTSACRNGTFVCTEKKGLLRGEAFGRTPQILPSSRVNDMVCDCCDGSDEWGGLVECPDSCSVG